MGNFGRHRPASANTVVYTSIADKHAISGASEPAPHTKKRRSVKVAISGAKARKAIRRSFQFMRTGQKSAVDRETPSDRKRKATHALAAPSHRGNDTSHHVRHRRHTIGFSGRTVL